MDMWDPYIHAVKKHVPHVKIVFDLFHVVSSFGKVIDKVRNAEYQKASKKDKDGSLESILKAFCKILPEILRDFIQRIVVGFGESAMAQSRKPFCCDECGNDKGFIWKTRHGKETRI
jgi:hypothetical protein